jgi:hypothetical protein
MAERDDEKLRALLADVTVDDAGLLALLGEVSGDAPKAGLTDPDEGTISLHDDSGRLRRGRLSSERLLG